MPHSSQTSIQHLFKPLTNLLSPPHKLTLLSPKYSMKTLPAFCIFALFSLYFFSTFSKLRFFNYPEYNQTRVHALYKNSIKVAHEMDHKTNISHILFGVSGSAKTWSRRRRYCELWWKPNVTRGFVWLDDEPEKPAHEQWPKTSPPYRVSANTARLKYSCRYGSRSAVRIARIVKESFELGLENVRWLVMGDDDTVFFTENLVSVLNRYDHMEMYYIGGNSESVDQDVIHSYSMGYGGGGFAVSRPLAAELVRILDSCIDRYAAFYGSDQKIGACMADIGVPLTKELGFHQLDIRGSAYGLLSAHPLAPLVSLHHLDSVHPLFPGTDRVTSVKKLMTAHETDPGRVLQHTFCYDLTRNWSVSVAWGYNVQLYPFLVTAKDLSTPLRTFLTWAWKQGPFTFDTRAMSLDPCERPVVFLLEGRAEEFKDGDTLTRYTRNNSVQWSECKRDGYEAAYLVKGFNVSAPIFHPHLWNKLNVYDPSTSFFGNRVRSRANSSKISTTKFRVLAEVDDEDRWKGLSIDVSDDQQDITRGKGMVDTLFQAPIGAGTHDAVLSSYEYLTAGLREFKFDNNMNGYYIAPAFMDKLSLHIAKNFMNLPHIKVPLILGIWGGKGQGKTFQCELVFAKMGIDPIMMSAGELESGNAGEPAKLIRQRYRDASDRIKKGRMCVLFINDLDAGAGRFGGITQYTVNNQMVNATLMNIADNPTNVQLPGMYNTQQNPRVPIVVTGNDFSTLYAPLIRDGRMEKFYWAPTREDRIGVCFGIFGMENVPREDVVKLVTAFPGQSIDFFGAIRARVYDDEVRKWISNVGVENMGSKLVNSREKLPEFEQPKMTLTKLIEYGNMLVQEQENVKRIQLSHKYLNEAALGNANEDKITNRAFD